MNLLKHHSQLRTPVQRVLEFGACYAVGAVVDQVGFAVAHPLQPALRNALRYQKGNGGLCALFAEACVVFGGAAGIGVGAELNAQDGIVAQDGGQVLIIILQD